MTIKDELSPPNGVGVMPSLGSAAGTLFEQIDQLQQALQSRAQIDQAKGILMLRFGLDADRAFALMTRWSQHHNLKLRVVALNVVELASGPAPSLGSIAEIECAVTSRALACTVIPEN